MFKRIGGLFRNASLILGNTLLLIVLLEASFSLVYLLQDRFSGDNLRTPDPHVMADAYGDASWVNHYWEEFASSEGVEWSPYVYWRRKPYRGQYINIGKGGLRVTTDVAISEKDSKDPVKIFMFGGSTMWGTGARDAFTIPSIVARELRRKGLAAEVRNFGESGYVSTQEVVALMRLLQQGDVPDLAIFYDGINDTYSAYQQHVAGVPLNEFNRVREFNLSNLDKVNERRALALQDVSMQLGTMRFLRGLHWRFRVPISNESTMNPFLVDHRSFDSDPVAQEVIQQYVGNIELVKALSEHYAFKYVFYWQPTIFEKPSLTGYERAEREKMNGVEPFYHKTYATLEKNEAVGKAGNDFRNLGAVFSKVKDPIFVDWCHLSETGNEVIAQIMINDALDRITAGERGAR